MKTFKTLPVWFALLGFVMCGAFSTARGALTLAVPDPSRVQIRNGGGVEFEFTCGPQTGRKVMVEYAPERLLQPEAIASIVVESLALPRTAEVMDLRIRPMLKP